jgi:hypothetical protein
LVVVVLALVVVVDGSLVVSFVVVGRRPCAFDSLVCRNLVGVVHQYVVHHVVGLLVHVDLHVPYRLVSYLDLLVLLGILVSFRVHLLAFAIAFVVGRMAFVGILAFVGSIVVHLALAC